MREYSFENIEKSYGKKRVLRGVSLHIPAGSFVGILGLNGTGKSTLLNILGNADRNFAGEVSLRGNAVAYMRTKTVFPEWRKVSDLLSFYQRFYQFDRKKAERMLENTSVRQNMRLRSLSAGMQRQVNFICNFCVDSQVLLLDEPLTNLDLIFRGVIVDSLIERSLDERVIIVATHEIKEFENLFTHVSVLKDGLLGELTETERLRGEGKSVEDFYRESVQ